MSKRRSPPPGAGGAERRVGPWLGREVEAEVGPVAHGGHCVARVEGRVVFVRHALPGERVIARVTEDGGGSYCRADAVRVLRPSPDRVVPPCPHAGPGRCGGCDWQHATGAAQRALKASVVREQLARLAGLPDVPVVVEPLPAPAGRPPADPGGAADHLPGVDVPGAAGGAGSGEEGLLGWRTRVRFAVGPHGRTGLRRHRSHELEPVERCPLGTAGVAAAGVGTRRWPGTAEVEVVAATGGDTAVVTWAAPGAPPPGEPAGRADRSRDRSGAGRPGRGTAPSEAATVIGPPVVREVAGGREWRVSTTGFWQVHPAAADTLARCVLDLLRPAPGETALDLYAGAGLFAGLLAAAVGPTGRVVAVEADPTAAADAAANLPGPAPAQAGPAPGAAGLAPAGPVPESGAGAPGGGVGGPGGGAGGPAPAGAAPVEVRAARVTPGLLGGLGLRPDLVVLDPPRSGAGTGVMAALLALGPRAVAYVACDPAALARDLRVAVDAGWAVRALRAFDCFPMTHHVETVALLDRSR